MGKKILVGAEWTESLRKRGNRTVSVANNGYSRCRPCADENKPEQLLDEIEKKTYHIETWVRSSFFSADNCCTFRRSADATSLKSSRVKLSSHNWVRIRCHASGEVAKFRTGARKYAMGTDDARCHNDHLFRPQEPAALRLCRTKDGNSYDPRIHREPLRAPRSFFNHCSASR